MILLPKDAIQTKSGFFDFTNIKPETIDIRDIAHALSNSCRFGGHVDRFYSVAQHSCYIYDRMMFDGQTRASCFYGLTHDCHEAYYGDMVRPLKTYLKQHYNFDFNAMTDEFDSALLQRYNITLEDHDYDLVKWYDNAALFTEKAALFDSQVDWGWEHPMFDVTVLLRDYVRRQTDWTEEFMSRFDTCVEAIKLEDVTLSDEALEI